MLRKPKGNITKQALRWNPSGKQSWGGQNILGEGEWNLRWPQRDTISVDWKLWPKIVSDGNTLLMA